MNGDFMKMVYKVNYTISAEDGDVNFTNFFYAIDTNEIHESIKCIMEDHGVDMKDVFTQDCAIYGVGNEFDITITIEQCHIFDDAALDMVLNDPN